MSNPTYTHWIHVTGDSGSEVLDHIYTAEPGVTNTTDGPRSSAVRGCTAAGCRTVVQFANDRKYIT
jgi:hypothetical protein